MSETGEQQIIITIPLFLKKLWKMVNDEKAEDIIGWNTSGDGFVIYDQVKFITELLPQYFKHNNLASFVRQLNFYDFHKVANAPKNEIEFAHPYFLKDLPETLGFITRKCPNLKSKASAPNEEEIKGILNDVKELKTKHHLVDNELQLLKQENASLWNEINSLRVKYSRQTKIINKLIHFLITYIHSHQGAFSKHKAPVPKKTETRNLQTSPQLLQIDYLNPKQVPTNSQLKQETDIDEPSSSKTVTFNKLSVEIEDLLQETAAEDLPEYYTVSYPEKQGKAQSTIQYPIEEIVTECDPFLEESSIYTVKFPKSRNKKLLESQIPSPTLIKTNVHKDSDLFSIASDSPSTQIVLDVPKNKKKRLLKRTYSKTSKKGLEDSLKVSKISQQLHSSKENVTSCHEDIANISKIPDNVLSSEIDATVLDNLNVGALDNLNVENQFFNICPDLENILHTSEVDISTSANKKIEGSGDVVSNLSSSFNSIKTVPSSSTDIMKYNILENPKENLGMFLDNSQVQLGNLQEILNNLNAKEIADLATCFNLSESCEANDSERNNLIAISQEWEDELSNLPVGVSNSGTEEGNQVCSVSNLDSDKIDSDDDLVQFNLP